MCLAEFAARYVTNYQRGGENDALPPCESEITSSHITLTDGLGKMNKHRREAVIRFHRYNKDAEPTNWYRAKLMLYFPWYNEDTELLGGYATYTEHYNSVCHIVLANGNRFTRANIDNIDIDENSPPQHVRNNIAPSTEEGQSHSFREGNEILTEVSPENVQNNANLFSVSTTVSTASSLHARFDTSTNREEIPTDEYRKVLRQLNAKQRAIVMFHHDWCKKAVIALK